MPKIRFQARDEGAERFTRAMNCPLCHKCVEHEDFPGKCIYGGPFNGFIDVSRRPHKFWYIKKAIRTFTEVYGVKSDQYGPKRRVKTPYLAAYEESS